MKKQSAPKSTKSRATTTRRANNAPIKVTPIVQNQKACFNPWSLSIYIYWFIILFFIAATFYILGRSHDVLKSQKNH